MISKSSSVRTISDYEMNNIVKLVKKAKTHVGKIKYPLRAQKVYSNDQFCFSAKKSSSDCFKASKLRSDYNKIY